jgi:hypothetical protein
VADKVATGVLVNNNALFRYTHTAGKSEQEPGGGAPYGNRGAFIGIHTAENPGLGQTALTKAYNVAAADGGNFQY